MGSDRHRTRICEPQSCGPVEAVHCVYLLHFPDGGHYIGMTSKGALHRLARHLGGRGSRYVARRHREVGEPVLGLVVRYSSRDEAFRMEKVHKRNPQYLRRRCKVCLKGGV